MPQGRVKWTPEQVRAKKDNDALAKKERENQTIVITDKWKITRPDEHNWAIIRKGYENQPYYYGRLLDALNALPHKLLDEGQKKDLRSILAQMTEIKGIIEHLRFYTFSELQDIS